MTSASILSLATFMILCSTSFFLGILFSLFPYDYPLLWSAEQVTDVHLKNMEAHLKLLYNSPNIIGRIFHIVTGIGLLGLLIKLYKPTESNKLFDGGSLVLYMIAVVTYLTNILKGLRIVDYGAYGALNMAEMTQEQLDEVDYSGNDAETGDMIIGREDSLKVLGASNTITALVLLGVIVLQVGQWYADRVDAREMKKFVEAEKKRQAEADAAEEAKTTGAASPVVENTPVKRGGSKKSK